MYIIILDKVAKNLTHMFASSLALDVDIGYIVCRLTRTLLHVT